MRVNIGLSGLLALFPQDGGPRRDIIESTLGAWESFSITIHTYPNRASEKDSHVFAKPTLFLLERRTFAKLKLLQVQARYPPEVTTSDAGIFIRAPKLETVVWGTPHAAMINPSANLRICDLRLECKREEQ